jgi:hypothetical protein
MAQTVAPVTTVSKAKQICIQRGFKVYAHYVSTGQNVYPKMLSYTVLSFRGGVCFGGLNSRQGKDEFIKWVNEYLL